MDFYRWLLTRVADEGWSHILLDGKLFATDRLTDTAATGTCATKA